MTTFEDLTASSAALRIRNERSFISVSKTMAKGENTRRSIQEAAYELFMRQGFHATSMRQIAQHAGLALGGIYNHFASKQEIFEAIIFEKHPYQQILPLLDTAEGETVDEWVRSIAQALLAELNNRPEFLKLMFIEIVEFNGQHVPRLMRQVFPQALPAFERMAAHHRTLRPIHPAVLMRSFIGLFFSYYVTDVFIRHTPLAKFMPKNSFEVFVDIYLHGILKEPS